MPVRLHEPSAQMLRADELAANGPSELTSYEKTLAEGCRAEAVTEVGIEETRGLPKTVLANAFRVLET